MDKIKTPIRLATMESRSEINKTPVDQIIKVRTVTQEETVARAK